MAHSLSAKKRIRQNITRRSRNRGRKARIHDLEKAFDQALIKPDLDQAQLQFRTLCGYLDRIALTSTLHKNTVARKKSTAARRLAQLQTS